ncbi:MAG: hypothetical protein H6667_05515 [Ardenticatenaceae bacterium]|nr:hypothetical protein [Ardenticatenaceae bacterium]MCB9444642.1 hypothetical protein [Ardenticatenaceae bacterium]
MSSFDEYLFVDRLKKLKGFEKLLLPQTRQAVMAIEGPQDMGKTWLVSKMRQHCQQPELNLPAVQIDFRNPREMHEIQDVLGLVRLLRNKLGYDGYFNRLNETINSFSQADLSAATDGLQGLRRNLEASFNLDELRGLCFDLAVNFENLAGDTLHMKTIELVSYCQRRRLLARLVTTCRELRPEVDWQTGMDVTLGDEAAVGDTAVPPTTAFITDNNALLRADSQQERQHAERQISSAFFDGLAAIMQDKSLAVFLFDSVEAAPPEAQRWLLDEMLPRLNDEALKDMVVIITGRKTPDMSRLDIQHLLVETKLEPFVETDIREYFEQRRKITGLDLRTIILTSGGIPGALAMMADHALITTEADDDFFSDV